MVSKVEQAIIRTLVYADIFDYPLKHDEICTYLIKIKDQSRRYVGTKIKNTIKKLKMVNNKTGCYFLLGKEEIVGIRRKREKWARGKLKIARKVANYLSYIPSIKLIGVTGALAVNNSKKDDDIDLMIVTKKGLLWTTRLLTTLLVELLGVRRRPDDFKTNNKICLNMFLDEEHLSVPIKERDLFSAHEVVQMKPLYDRDKTYEKFLLENLWVKEHLPNAIKIKNAVKSPRGWQPRLNRGMTPPMVEELVKSFQLWYMKSRRTTEVIKDGIIRFHPQDAREWVLREYRMRLKRLSRR